MLIFLVGFMGCGKSTVGRRVARKLGYSFVDMDSKIEEQAGRNVSDIFNELGEEAFRKMESDFIDSLTDKENTIVATGGGAPCFGDNMACMLGKGNVVYFYMKPEVLLGRLIAGQHKRPKLAGMNHAELLEYVRETLAEREHYYNRASMTIDCNGVSDDYIVSHIATYIDAVVNK